VGARLPALQKFLQPAVIFGVSPLGVRAARTGMLVGAMGGLARQEAA
jgi:hypothetical protein